MSKKRQFVCENNCFVPHKAHNGYFGIRKFEMVVLGALFKRGLQLRIKLSMKAFAPVKQQEIVLRKLLNKAKDTEIGRYYGFASMLKNPDIFKEYSRRVDLYDYNSIYERWWSRSREGYPNVAWPGKIMYFALSSGTSEAASKFIPVTTEMIKAMRSASVKQIFTLAQYNFSSDLYEKGMLMLGGSTHLNYSGRYYYGDLSGINTGKIPFWFERFYKPGKAISKLKDWDAKINDIVKNAPEWDIWVIAGVPAWLQIMMERIIEQYKLDNIHDIWPNLKVYATGGVAFEPYKKSFETLLAHPLIYFETYLASEGFIAYDARPQDVRKGMRLILNNGIYYEFVPFTPDNFDEEGGLKPHAATYNVGQVKEGVDYALLLSTVSGAWRYLIGDTIRFTSLEHMEIKITGRTKHFISLCGEHLSVENMNQAIAHVAETLNMEIKEFTLIGEPYESLFAHHWYIGSDSVVDIVAVKKCLDETLCAINDDYAVERRHALKEIVVEQLPAHLFTNWLAAKGKLGGQHKFPRVLKGEQAELWRNFILQPHI